jgi:hypothetical protein
MRRLLPLIALSALAGPLPASADGSIVLSGRAGAATPFGDVANGGQLGDAVEWAFPLQADLQFRFAKRFQAGAYGRYAPTTLASRVDDRCDAAGASCGYEDIAFGGILEYRFRDRLEAGPWVGATVGYELLRAEETSGGVKSETTFSGFEAGVQGGMDFELGGITIGPWASLSAGQFSKADRDAGSDDITDKGVHGWFQVGLRFSLLL